MFCLSHLTDFIHATEEFGKRKVGRGDGQCVWTTSKYPMYCLNCTITCIPQRICAVKVGKTEKQCQLVNHQFQSHIIGTTDEVIGECQGFWQLYKSSRPLLGHHTCPQTSHNLSWTTKFGVSKWFVDPRDAFRYSCVPWDSGTCALSCWVVTADITLTVASQFCLMCGVISAWCTAAFGCLNFNVSKL